jgi:hypothetical protein
MILHGYDAAGGLGARLIVRDLLRFVAIKPLTKLFEQERTWNTSIEALNNGSRVELVWCHRNVIALGAPFMMQSFFGDAPHNHDYAFSRL